MLSAAGGGSILDNIVVAKKEEPQKQSANVPSILESFGSP